MTAIGAESSDLLDALTRLTTPPAATIHPAVSVLRRVLARYFERPEDCTGGARLRPVQGHGPGDRLESPYDADARFRAESSARWFGGAGVQSPRVEPVLTEL